MNARRFLALFGLLAIGTLVSVARRGRGDFITPSAFIFRSAEEIIALRGLLDDEEAFSELLSLSEHLALWRMGTLSELLEEGAGDPAPEESDPPEPGDPALLSIRHRFEFAGIRGTSSRVYRVEYTSEESGRDPHGRPTFSVRRTRAGFGSSYQRGAGPVLGGSVPLRILKHAVGDEGVSLDLVDALRQENIGYCNVTYEEDEPSSGVARYRLTVADAAPPARIVLEYLVEYDGELDAARFVRL